MRRTAPAFIISTLLMAGCFESPEESDSKDPVANGRIIDSIVFNNYDYYYAAEKMRKMENSAEEYYFTEYSPEAKAMLTDDTSLFVVDSVFMISGWSTNIFLKPKYPPGGWDNISNFQPFLKCTSQPVENKNWFFKIGPLDSVFQYCYRNDSATAFSVKRNPSYFLDKGFTFDPAVFPYPAHLLKTKIYYWR